MPTTITESTGASANFPASLQGPLTGEPVSVVPFNQLITNLANRTQWNKAFGGDQILSFLNWIGITPNPADPTLLRDAIAQFVGLIGTWNQISGVTYLHGKGLRYDGDDESSALSSLAHFFGSTSVAGQTVLEATSRNTGAALKGNGGTTGKGGEFFSGTASGDALQATTTATGAAIRAKATSFNIPDGVLKVEGFPGIDQAGIVTTNRIDFRPTSSSSEPIGGSLGGPNRLYAANICKSYGAVSGSPPTLQSGAFNVSQVGLDGAGYICKVTFAQPMANANYSVQVTTATSTSSPNECVLMNAASGYGRTTTDFHVLQRNTATNGTVNFDANSEFTFTVFGRQ